MNALRLAVANAQNEERGLAFAPSVRLAHCGPPEALVHGLKPDVRLAATGNGCEDRSGLDGAMLPALLVSYYYLAPFLEARKRYAFRDWALDSGAYSAHNAGAAIDLEQYIAEALRLKAEDPQLSEVFALDVIGDWRASAKNTERMWAAGV